MIWDWFFEGIRKSFFSFLLLVSFLVFAIESKGAKSYNGYFLHEGFNNYTIYEVYELEGGFSSLDYPPLIVLAYMQFSELDCFPKYEKCRKMVLAAFNFGESTLFVNGAKAQSLDLGVPETTLIQAIGLGGHVTQLPNNFKAEIRIPRKLKHDLGSNLNLSVSTEPGGAKFLNVDARGENQLSRRYKKIPYGQDEAITKKTHLFAGMAQLNHYGVMTPLSDLRFSVFAHTEAWEYEDYDSLKRELVKKRGTRHQLLAFALDQADDLSERPDPRFAIYGDLFFDAEGKPDLRGKFQVVQVMSLDSKSQRSQNPDLTDKLRFQGIVSNVKEISLHLKSSRGVKPNLSMVFGDQDLVSLPVRDHEKGTNLGVKVLTPSGLIDAIRVRAIPKVALTPRPDYDMLPVRDPGVLKAIFNVIEAELKPHHEDEFWNGIQAPTCVEILKGKN